MPTVASQLRESLFPLLGGSHSSRQLNTIVNICLSLASELLERKWRSRKLMQMQGISETDLAYDCIADLFQQNESGRLVQIEAYFSSVGVECAGEEELLIYLRRLVYARVNQAIFRMYQDVDPVLSKILRNVKIAVQKLAQFEEIERFGETFLTPLLCDRLQHLPPVDEQLIEQHLLSVCTGVENVPQMLAEIALYLRQQEDHARLIGLMVAAKTIQSVYELKNRPLLEGAEVQPSYEVIDIASIIKSVCMKVKQEMYVRYVQKRKVTGDLFDAYFDAIETNLILRFVDADGDCKTYFELLKKQLPELTLKEYRSQHRAKVEYLGALASKRAVKTLKSHIM